MGARIISRIYPKPSYVSFTLFFYSIQCAITILSRSIKLSLFDLCLKIVFGPTYPIRSAFACLSKSAISKSCISFRSLILICLKSLPVPFKRFFSSLNKAPRYRGIPGLHYFCKALCSKSNLRLLCFSRSITIVFPNLKNDFFSSLFLGDIWQMHKEAFSRIFILITQYFLHNCINFTNRINISDCHFFIKLHGCKIH